MEPSKVQIPHPENLYLIYLYPQTHMHVDIHCKISTLSILFFNLVGFYLCFFCGLCYCQNSGCKRIWLFWTSAPKVAALACACFCQLLGSWFWLLSYTYWSNICNNNNGKHCFLFVLCGSWCELAFVAPVMVVNNIWLPCFLLVIFCLRNAIGEVLRCFCKSHL